MKFLNNNNLLKNDFIKGGMTQTVVGHPFDTIKVLQQDIKLMKILNLRIYYIKKIFIKDYHHVFLVNGISFSLYD